MAGEGIHGEPVPRPDIVGKCPEVIVDVEGVEIPCLLDTGSQVTLFSESFFQKWLGHIQLRNKEDLSWMELRAANGLNIPYTGYAVLDFAVGGVKVPRGNHCER